MFHGADIGIYGYGAQNVDIDVMARFKMKEWEGGRAAKTQRDKG
jgi:hypothetical protein